MEKENCKQCDSTKNVIIKSKISSPCICYSCNTIYLLDGNETKVISEKEATNILKSN